MINDKKYPIDYEHAGLDCPDIERRIGRRLNHEAFLMAMFFGLDGLYESDIQWIENNITKNSKNNIRDIFWKQDSYTYETHTNIYFLDYLATFLEQFMDTPGIPQNVNCLLWCAVGKMRAWYNIEKPQSYQHFLVESWMRKTRGGGVENTVKTIGYIKYSVAG